MDAEAEELNRRTGLLPSVIAQLPSSPWQPVLRPLLEMGPWRGGSEPIALADQSWWLVHTGSLISERQDERAIDAFDVRATADGPPLARFVRKSVWDSSGTPRLGLADEALFLAGPARDLTGRSFRLPQLHGCASSPRGVSLVIERVPASLRPPDWATARRSAAALGELGAISHAKRLYDSQLVKPLGQGFQLRTADNLLQLAQLCLTGRKEQRVLLDAFFAVFSEPLLLRRIRERLCPCICHDDVFRRNMLMPDGEDAIVIIDWGKVRSGFIGHDAGMLLLPGYISSRRLRRVTDFAEAAGRVFRALWRGVDEVGAGVTRERVRLGFDLALLQGIARLGDHSSELFTRITKAADADELQARRQGMASVLDFGRRKAEELARRFG